MEKILVSSCLLGQPVRYDGRGHAILHPQLNLWQKQNRLIVFCPEVAGGLPIPGAC
ncbi:MULTISPECIES: 2-thiouracil desulfurase family protein [unclassified Pseudoalteromonas]|uniref:2-thiouracil desulfurase family protein n=1 Tax=unclassified Pseudoalteromonas TaxID=194690 RepID=UPI0026AD3B3B